MDSRIIPDKKRLIIEFDDNTPLLFESADLKWIGEQFQDVLDQNYDVLIETISIERWRKSTESWIPE